MSKTDDIEQGQHWLDGRAEFRVVKIWDDCIEVQYLDDPSDVHSWHHQDRFDKEFERV